MIATTTAKLAIARTHTRFYAVAVLTGGEALQEIPLHALRTRAQVDRLLRQGYTLRTQLAEQVYR